MEKLGKKAVITGGLGFIGSHLTERLLDRGFETIIIDNKSTNVVSENFFKNSNCKIHIQSIKDFDFNTLKNVDIVFHLASILGPSGILDHAGDIAIKTISDVVKIRDYCIKNEIPLIDISTIRDYCIKNEIPLIDISPSEVYGHSGILREDSKKVFSGESKVRPEYGIGKLGSEMALINKAKVDSRLRYNLIRPFNVTGPRQKPDAGFVLPRFAMEKLGKKAVITGGLGFIGSHLTERLLDRGFETIIIDNKSTNVVSENFFKKSNCKVHIQSIKDFDFNTLKNVDIVFHLASILGPSGILDHAGDIAIKTISDVVKIRDYCIKNEIPLIDISTSEVYGHSGILREDSKKVFSGESKVRPEYGIGKLGSEMALINKAKVDPRLRYNLIRPFNVTGPRQKPDAGFVLPRFAISALTNQPITVFGDGTQRRAFTHVQDICESILAVYDSEYKNEIWNVGRPNNEMSINEMADQIINLTKKKFTGINPTKLYIDPKKIHGPLFEEAVDKIPYIEKITQKIGWKPKISSEQIFSEVLDFYKEKIDNGYSFKTS